LSCWGLNSSGQVGDGGFSRRTSPTQVELEDGTVLAGVEEVGAGTAHACARLEGGEVLCWGNNLTNQLAEGSASALERNPVDTGVTGAEQLAVGGGSGFVVQADGSALAWGSNTFGNLGIGGGGNSATPTRVMTTSSLARITSAGSGTTCAVDRASVPLCWGRNDAGHVGDGTMSNRDAPVPVSGVTEAFSVHPGYQRTFVITPEGAVLSLSDSAPAYVTF
jgi:alpha-tubulin suppressor-like RCC1 family protein